MKLTVIGGGGFRVPLVHQAATAADAPVRVDEVCLYDVSASRMAAVRAVIEGATEELPHAPLARLTCTTDLDEALRGADFIFCAIRVGGLEGRVKDETVALDLDVLGQETTGPGGLSYALRTVPVMRRLAQRVKELAPEAFFINFTNPAGIVTEALKPILGERVVGICDTPLGLMRRIERLTGVDATGVDYVGLNHLGWLRRVFGPNGDLLPAVLADDDALANIEEARLMGFDWVRQVGAIPNEYMYYYYFNREAVERIRRSKSTRGQSLVEEQRDFYDTARQGPRQALDAWHAATDQRESTYMAEARPTGHEDDRLPEDLEGGYHKVALDIMGALTNGAPSGLILNITNSLAGRSVIAGLPADCVVEAPCVVDGSGIRPAAVAPVDGQMLGLLQEVKAVEQLTIAAATEGSADLAWRAMSLHPLVDSVNIAKQLVDRYRRAHPGLAYLK
jgi:6-phospho-beta-glucosidase